MAITADDLRTEPGIGSWRTPLVIIVCGCVIALLSFGPRSSLGFFVQPMSWEFSWGRDVFGLALAVQNLLWGLGQPFRLRARYMCCRCSLCRRSGHDALSRDAAVA